MTSNCILTDDLGVEEFAGELNLEDRFDLDNFKFGILDSSLTNGPLDWARWGH